MLINATGADELSVSGSRSCGGESSGISVLDLKELYICPRSFLNHWTVDFKVRSRQSSFHQLNSELLDASPWMYFCHSAEIFLYSSWTVKVNIHFLITKTACSDNLENDFFVFFLKKRFSVRIVRRACRESYLHAEFCLNQMMLFGIFRNILHIYVYIYILLFGNKMTWKYQFLI